MKTRLLFPLFLIVGILLSDITSNAQALTPQQKKERIQASYMLALGRVPAANEITYWQGQANQTIPQYIALHKQFIAKDAGTKTAVITKAYADALGRTPTPAEITYWSAGNNTYTELMKNHVQWLVGNPAEYEKVIKRSYQFILNRQPSAPEIAYWKTQGTLSYLVLIGCHADWKARNNNNASTQKTSGASSLSLNGPLIASVTLSPAIASEARSAAATVSNNSLSNLIAAGGGNVVAAGGGNVVAAGGGNVVAAGGGNLIASAANVVAAGGGN